MLVKVKQFLTKSETNPVPLRTMRIIETKRETAKAVLVSLVGTPLPQSECVHCGRTITHPQSLHFGIGSTCINKFPELLASYNPDEIEKTYNELKEKMTKIVWEGWLPKAHIELITEPSQTEIVFTYQNKQYRVITDNEEKLQEIINKADQVVSTREVVL